RTTAAAAVAGTGCAVHTSRRHSSSRASQFAEQADRVVGVVAVSRLRAEESASGDVVTPQAILPNLRDASIDSEGGEDGHALKFLRLIVPAAVTHCSCSVGTASEGWQEICSAPAPRGAGRRLVRPSSTQA